MTNRMRIEDGHAALPAALLAWYDVHARVLPWRMGPAERATGRRPEAYHVWLSEVMLQQTTVTAVKPYFAKFLARWPRLQDLAAADREEVLAAWAGLGYYSRARNLYACAQVVHGEHASQFPDNQATLKKLPGIGDYTSASIAAIAFGEAVPVVDGNVERVISRVFTIDTPLPKARKEIRAALGPLVPAERPGEFAEAMMDLGATICTPRKPVCALCPLDQLCLARKEDPEIYPVKPAKKRTPTRYGAAFLCQDEQGQVFLQKRPETGLLGGMTEIPTTDWQETKEKPVEENWHRHAPFPEDGLSWRYCGEIVHVFTHFRLELAIFRADIRRASGMSARGGNQGWWCREKDLDDQALPNVMQKAIACALKT